MGPMEKAKETQALAFRLFLGGKSDAFFESGYSSREAQLCAKAIVVENQKQLLPVLFSFAVDEAMIEKVTNCRRQKKRGG